MTVYSGRSESLVGLVFKLFTDATGIQVNVKYGSTSAIAATILEEGDRSPADIFFAQDPGDLGALSKIMWPLPDDIVGAVPPWARSAEARWVGITGRARVVVYNKDSQTEANLPESIEGFTGPEWKGKVGWAPTNASFQSMVTAMRVLWGEERTAAWVKGMRANGAVTYADNNSLVKAVASGEIEVGFTNHYYVYEIAAQEGSELDAVNYFTRASDPGSVVLVAGAGILATSLHKPDAIELLRFLLSAEAQSYFAREVFEYPLVDGVARESRLPDLDKIKRPDIDLSALADVKGTQTLLRDAGAIP